METRAHTYSPFQKNIDEFNELLSVVNAWYRMAKLSPSDEEELYDTLSNIKHELTPTLPLLSEDIVTPPDLTNGEIQLRRDSRADGPCPQACSLGKRPGRGRRFSCTKIMDEPCLLQNSNTVVSLTYRSCFVRESCSAKVYRSRVQL